MQYLFLLLSLFLFSTSLVAVNLQNTPENQLRELLRQDMLKEFPKPPLNSLEPNLHIFTVVIDPGHGGKDTGACGPNDIFEKDIVLSIAKKLAKQINQKPHMRAVLTRKGDYFIPLRKRLTIARKVKADLFIAIHADAYFTKRAHGASIFALSQHGASSEAARWLALKANYSELDGIEFDSLKDDSKLIRSVLIDLSQTNTIKDSIYFADLVLKSLSKIAKLHRGKVEEAPFMVLKSPDIPSVLIETGFITNLNEANLLRTPQYQNELSRAIWQGVYLYERRNAMLNGYAFVQRSHDLLA